MKRLLTVCCLLFWVTAVSVSGESCPRPTPMTAPAVFHFEHQVNGGTWQEIRVWVVLSDQFGDFESPLILYRGSGLVWRTNARPGNQPTVCQEQYQQFIDYSLGVLNVGKRPFTYDNQGSLTDYEAFLLSKVELRVYLPLVMN